MAPESEDLVASGGEALKVGDWSAARSAFEAALEQEETAEALFGLGDALWWLGEIEPAVRCRERAYAAFRRRSDPVQAAIVAMRLCLTYRANLGSRAASRGWLRRAARIVEDFELDPLRGWVALMRANDAEDPVAVVVSLAVATPVAAQETGALSHAPAAAPTSALEPQKDAAPEHAHTGWATLVKDTGRDFIAFPKRRSTWAILGIGAAAALATRPTDNYVESHIVGNTTAERTFTVGTGAGSAYRQIGTGVGLWAVGRYVTAPVANEPRTNQSSAIGFDAIRAQIVSQVVVGSMKHAGLEEAVEAQPA